MQTALTTGALSQLCKPYDKRGAKDTKGTVKLKNNKQPLYGSFFPTVLEDLILQTSLTGM